MQKISSETRRDPVLARVLNYTLSGWPNYVTSDELKPYFTRRHELLQGCVLWGMRVIIPPSLRNRLLQELHEEHPGNVAMKAIARSNIWWPNLNAEIELTGKTYEVCQAVRNSPHPLVHHCTHGDGLLGYGKECILILQRKMAISSLG